MFLIPENALTAFNELNESVFQGRCLKIVAANEKPAAQQENEESSETLTFKQKRQIESKTQSSKNEFSWNSLFMNVYLDLL